MGLRVSGKNLDVGEALRGQVEARVASALGKYFDGDYSGHVTVAKDGAGFRTECVLHLTSGITLEASGAAPDAYASFDQTAERIEKRLRRYKRRLKDRPAGTGKRPDGALDSAYAVLESPAEPAHGAAIPPGAGPARTAPGGTRARTGCRSVPGIGPARRAAGDRRAGAPTGPSVGHRPGRATDRNRRR